MSDGTPLDEYCLAGPNPNKKARRKPSDFTTARELIDYLSGKHCADETCEECLVIDREEAIYFIDTMIKQTREQCAAVADQYDKEHPGDYFGAAQAIATRIRGTK